jgi:uncharacterized protein (TIGR03435 family)
MQKLAVAGALGVVAIWAQVDRPAAGGLRFEVASLKTARSRFPFRGGPGTDDPTRFSGSSEMFGLLRVAVGAAPPPGLRLEGAPEWALGDRFQITANVPAGTTKEQFRVMLQNLLEERMGLAFHRSKREIDAYTLVVAKGGLKLKPAAPVGGPPPAPAPGMPLPLSLDEDQYPRMPAGYSYAQARSTNGVVRMTIQHSSITEIANALTRGIVPITDGTRLTGLYDGKVAYSEQSIIDLLGAHVPPSGDDPAPDVFAAFEKQLGLRLEKGKMQIDVVTIDHLDREPREN